MCGPWTRMCVFCSPLPLPLAFHVTALGSPPWAHRRPLLIASQICTPAQIAWRYNQDGTAQWLVDRMVERLPPQGGTPVTDKALLERRGNELVGSRIEVLTKKTFGSASWARGTTIKYDEYKKKYSVLFDGAKKPTMVTFDPKNREAECRVLIPLETAVEVREGKEAQQGKGEGKIGATIAQARFEGPA